ncbi:MAG: hypothetical protein ACRD0O_20995, partial [Acidimicrobiia bacterium]
ANPAPWRSRGWAKPASLSSACPGPSTTRAACTTRWRGTGGWFSPESGVVGAEAFVVSGDGDGMDWSDTQGVTLAGDHLYLAGGDGSLRRVGFRHGHPLPGTESLVDGAPHWRNRGLFVG